jgi:acid phosphatase type 7
MWQSERRAQTPIRLSSTAYESKTLPCCCPCRWLWPRSFLYPGTLIVKSTASPIIHRRLFPDQVCLTWSGDPRTTQTVQWRTAVSVQDGWVEYREANASEEEVMAAEAALSIIEDEMLENDPVIHRFTVTLDGLKPGARYVYRAGSREKDVWTDWKAFRTAPQNPEPFSFLYLTDPHGGSKFWKGLLREAYRQHPDIAFTIIAGDLVNRGYHRNEWDRFFKASRGVFDHIPIAPTPGNHDYAKQKNPWMYMALFGLPENGSPAIPNELSYAFEYGNALFVSLDSNRSERLQAPWLEEQLAKSTATWKFVFFHHPAYAPTPRDDDSGVQRHWVPLFEKYGVDMVLQGHEHAYMRSYPIRDGEIVLPGEKGTVYVVSVSGTKFYEAEPRNKAEVAFTDTSTYQIIDIETNPDRLIYRAYNRPCEWRCSR